MNFSPLPSFLSKEVSALAEASHTRRSRQSKPQIAKFVRVKTPGLFPGQGPLKSQSMKLPLPGSLSAR